MPIDDRKLTAFALALTYLTPSDIAHFAQTSTAGRKLAEDDILWQSFLDPKREPIVKKSAPTPPHWRDKLVKYLPTAKPLFPLPAKPTLYRSARDIYQHQYYLRRFWSAYCDEVYSCDFPEVIKGVLTTNPEIIKFASCSGPTDWRKLLTIVKLQLPENINSMDHWKIHCNARDVHQFLNDLLLKIKPLLALYEYGGVGLTLDYIISIYELWPIAHYGRYTIATIGDLGCKKALPMYLPRDKGGIDFTLDFTLQFRRAMIAGPYFHRISTYRLDRYMECGLYNPYFYHHLYQAGLFLSIAEGGIGLSLAQILNLAQHYGRTMLQLDNLLHITLSPPYIRQLFQSPDKGGINLTLEDIVQLLQETNELREAYNDNFVHLFLCELAMVVSPNSAPKTEPKSIMTLIQQRHEQRYKPKPKPLPWHQQLKSFMFYQPPTHEPPPIEPAAPLISAAERYARLLEVNASYPVHMRLLSRVTVKATSHDDARATITTTTTVKACDL